MSKKISVIFNGQEIKTKPGTTILKVLETNPHPGERPALGAIVNQRLMGLYYTLRSDCSVRTIDYRSKGGANIYRRSLALILCEAVTQLYPDVRLEIGQSLANGYYYHAHSEKNPLSNKMLEAIDAKMREIIATDRPLRPSLVNTEEAQEMFIEARYTSKARMLRQRRNPEVPIVTIGEFFDIAHGPILPRTGLCPDFVLLPLLPGFVLSFPNRFGHLKSKITNQKKLFATYRESRTWNEMLGVWNVGQLNAACMSGSISDIIKVAEGFQEKKIASVADTITAKRDHIRLILIAGPSSSGKTTFTKRLAVQLMINGITPKAISLDNYYVNRENTPRNPDGTYDFEHIETLDLELFNAHLVELLGGDQIDAPIFDFVTGSRRSDKTLSMRLEKDQVLIVEGIHGLNPRLSASVAANNKFKINVSALTQLAIDEHNRIFTSDTRLLRRIVRDRLFRGYSASQTINQWRHVRDGENKWIFPFQEEADILFDTSLVYEQAVLKPYLQRFLMEVDNHDPAYVEAYRLANFLTLFIPIFSHEVPPTSILREFIGGSTFNY